SLFFFFFFFFQAEDGIRDLYVTGVQTVLFRSLLLVINAGHGLERLEAEDRLRPRDLRARRKRALHRGKRFCAAPPDGVELGFQRSEERRVGKEWRCRWAAGRRRKKAVE